MLPGVRRGSVAAVPPPSPSSSESNPTSLPIDVESDGNIFCSQNVAVVFSMLFCFVSCISMVPTLPREEKCS